MCSNVLLQVLDDGRLTGWAGPHGGFSQYRDHHDLQSGIAGHPGILGREETIRACAPAVMEIVQQSFRPEFINRIDDIVVFHPLGTEQIRKIVDIQLVYLRKRLQERNLDILLDDSARDLLGEAGFDPVYGAASAEAGPSSSRSRIRWRSTFCGASSHRGDTIQVQPPGRPAGLHPGRSNGRRSLYTLTILKFRLNQTATAEVKFPCRSTNTSAPTASSIRS